MNPFAQSKVKKKSSKVLSITNVRNSSTGLLYADVEGEGGGGYDVYFSLFANVVLLWVGNIFSYWNSSSIEK